jgi:predicted neuraminidase
MSSDARRGRASRRALIAAGLGAAAVGAVAASGASPRRILCRMFPAARRGGERSPAEMVRERIFADAPFASCHASTLAVSAAGLIACWFAGSAEGNSDVGIWSAVRGPSGWSAPALAATAADAEGKPVAAWNPVLWQPPDGLLRLFYKAGPSPRSWWGMTARSTDGGRSWGAPTRLPDGFIGPVRSKPLLLADGRLLCPSSSEDHGWRVHFEWTSDGGQTWERTPPIGDGHTLDIIQPTLLVHPGERLQALCRSRQGFIAELWSEDGGRSWSEPRLTSLPNPNSAIDALALPDGRHLLVHNPVSRCRSPLVVSLSSDGRSWREVVVLEHEPGEYSYPAVIADNDGRVHVSYTSRRETIAHVMLDPAKL